MNEKKLAEAVREKVAEFSAAEEGVTRMPPEQIRDAAELIRVLARIVEGKTLSQAFGAPGDWGYETAIGQALIARPEGEL